VLPDPSSFIAERRMLLGIKERAEQAAQPGIVHRHSASRLPVGGQGLAIE